jgi:putative oxidoreductase
MHTMGARIPEKRMQFSSSSSRSRFAQYTPYALAFLRVVVGFLFLQHGTAKFFGVPHVAALEGVQLFSLVGVAGVLEVAGGLLVLIGLFTRPAAFLLSGEMAVAYFMFHAARGSVLSPILNGGESAVLFCFIFLLIAAAGAGAWSIDGMRGRN